MGLMVTRPTREMKTKVPAIFLTYFMVNWGEVHQETSSQKCTDCGQSLRKTEVVEDEKGQKFEGYVCHSDKRVTWVRIG